MARNSESDDPYDLVDQSPEESTMNINQYETDFQDRLQSDLSNCRLEVSGLSRQMDKLRSTFPKPVDSSKIHQICTGTSNWVVIPGW